MHQTQNMKRQTFLSRLIDEERNKGATNELENSSIIIDHNDDDKVQYAFIAYIDDKE